MSLQQSDAEAAAHAVAPRVSLADIDAAIAQRIFVTGGEAVLACAQEPLRDSDRAWPPDVMDRLSIMTLCFVVMQNGFIVVGKSAPASPENFNAELGKKLAYEDAVRQIWPLMGFALKDRLAAARCVPASG